jgi:pilus assembly protein Flp/PilA
MKRFAQKLVTFIKEEDGPTAVEYAVMLALIIVVCLGTITSIGTNANATFQTISENLAGTGGSATP